MSTPVYALNLFDISSKEEYLAYAKRSVKEVKKSSWTRHGARKVP